MISAVAGVQSAPMLRAVTPLRSLRAAPTVSARFRVACSAAAAAPEGDVAVNFTLKHKVPFGQQVLLVGSTEQLGAWNVGAAVPLAWSKGHNWSASVQLPAGSTLEYKFVVASEGVSAPHWESCANRTLTVDPAAVHLLGAWEQPLSPSVKPSDETAVPSANPAAAEQATATGSAPELTEPAVAEDATPVSNGKPVASTKKKDSASIPAVEVGAEVEAEVGPQTVNNIMAASAEILGKAAKGGRRGQRKGPTASKK